MREAYNHGKAIAAAEEGADLLKAVGITTAPGVVYEKKGYNARAPLSKR